MLQGELSAILSPFINLSFVIKILVLSIFEWPLKTGFTVFASRVKSVDSGQLSSQNLHWFGDFKYPALA